MTLATITGQFTRFFSTDNRRNFDVEEHEPHDLKLIQKQTMLTDQTIDRKQYIQKYLQFVNSQNIQYQSLIDADAEGHRWTKSLDEFKGFNLEMENKGIQILQDNLSVSSTHLIGD